MGFLSPWLLGGLAAIGLPVWLHLLRQYKSTPRPFSSLMFFEQRVQSSIRHRRLKYRVLFALRALFVALLILAFARPVIETTGVASARDGRVLALLIDDSFSMQQGDRLARAKQAALQVAGGLRGADRAQVIVLGGATRLGTNLTNDRGALEAAIRAIEPGDGAASFAEATRAVRSIAQSTKTPVEAHLFSDMQKTSMPANFADLKLPDGAQLVPHAVATAPIPNLAVENVTAPRRVFDPKGVRVQATVVSFSDKDATARVSLMLNNAAVETRSVAVPAGGRASVEFLGLNAPYGLNRGEVRMASVDGFPLDDRYYFAVERSDPAPALFVSELGEARGGLYFQTALQSANQPAFALNLASYAQAETAGLGRYAFVVLSDPAVLSRGLETALEHYVQGGGSLLVVLGRQSAGNVPVLKLSITRNAGTPNAGSFASVSTADTTHPALRVPAQWDSPRFYRTIPVQAGAARVLLRLDDGTPLLMEGRAGEGRVMVFASALDNVDNDLPVNPLFVPFVQQMAGYLGRAETATGNYTAGAFYDLRPEGAQGDTQIEVTGPRGERVLSLAESAKARALPLERAGFYDIRRQNGRHELAAVNPDRRESDFAIVPPETLALWKNTGVRAASGGPGEASAQKNELWWYVLLAALALAVAESVLGNRHLEAKEGTA